MDANEEMIALLREIRDQQRRQLELHESWRADAERERHEWREEWSRQTEIYRSQAETYERTNREYLISKKSYDEANQLYLNSWKTNQRVGPLVLVVVIAFVSLAIFGGSIEWIREILR